MPSILKTLRLVSDPSRLRLLLLLAEEELSVAELQEILVLGQSTISSQLAQLKQAGLVEDRRTGKSNLYRMEAAAASGLLKDVLQEARLEVSEAEADRAAARLVLRKRQDRMRVFFDSVAGRLGKDYVPGRSWKSLAEALLRLLPPMEIADMGAGEGAFSLLLAQRAKRVVAIDASEKMLEVGREQAARHGIVNIEFRQGDMEEVPISNASLDLVFFSQSLHHALHPDRAIQEAARILRPGGRIVVLDLLKHRFEEARELYADEWLGFSEAELEALLTRAGFSAVQISVVDKEPETPQFQALLAVASKEQG
jgi:ArsR family transcriptional regulator